MQVFFATRIICAAAVPAPEMSAKEPFTREPVMTRTECIKALAKRNGVTQTKAAEGLRGFASLMQEKLLAEGEVSIWGLGKLKLVKRAERGARNPQTGERMRIPARKAIKFVPSKAVKEALR